MRWLVPISYYVRSSSWFLKLSSFIKRWGGVLQKQWRPSAVLAGLNTSLLGSWSSVVQEWWTATDFKSILSYFTFHDNKLIWWSCNLSISSRTTKQLFKQRTGGRVCRPDKRPLQGTSESSRFKITKMKYIRVCVTPKTAWFKGLLTNKEVLEELKLG